MITKENSFKFADFNSEILNKTVQGNFSLTAFEKIPIEKAKVLHEFMSDEIMFSNSALSEGKRAWLNLNISRLESILGRGSNNSDYYCSGSHVYRRVNYVQRDNIGRLYADSSCSIQHLPKEIRMFLFSGLYTDFDIKNAHPTLLLDFVRKHLSSQNYPLLTEYVTSRESFYKNISKNYDISSETVKIYCLKVINMTYSELFLALKKSTTLKDLSRSNTFINLNKEVLDIREHIYEKHYFQGSLLFSYLENNRDDFENKPRSKKLVSVQSLYLQTQETNYLYSLVKYLREQSVMDRDLSLDKLDMKFDKKISIDEYHHFCSCVPFFDGCFVGSEDKSYLKNNIESQVRTFNEKLKNEGSLVEFLKKEIKHPYKHLNEESLKSYYEVRQFINGLGMSTFSELLKLLKIDKISFDIVEISGKELNIMAKKTAFFRMKIYKTLIREIKLKNAEQYKNMDLLSYLRKK